MVWRAILALTELLRHLKRAFGGPRWWLTYIGLFVGVKCVSAPKIAPRRPRENSTQWAFPQVALTYRVWILFLIYHCYGDSIPFIPMSTSLLRLSNCNYVLWGRGRHGTNSWLFDRIVNSSLFTQLWIDRIEWWIVRQYSQHAASTQKPSTATQTSTT